MANTEIRPGGAHPLLRRGAKGPAVAEAQSKLNVVRQRSGLPLLVVDGDFGQRTFEAVAAFQRQAFPGQPSEWDGVLGNKTWAMLDAAAGGNVEPPLPPVPPIPKPPVPVPPIPPPPIPGRFEGVPKIEDVATRQATYSPPRIYYVGLERREARQAVELTVRTSVELPATAYSLIIFVGERPIPEWEPVGENLYRFFAYEPERLTRGAVISLGTQQAPDRKVASRFRYQPDIVVALREAAESDGAAGITGDLADSFFDALRQTAAALGTQPEYLLAVLNAESGLRADAHNPSGHASGLIQFMPATLLALGWTQGHAAFRRLSAEEQLPFVERYYQPFVAQGLHSTARLYQATLLPATLKRGSAPETVLVDVHNDDHVSAYAPNRGLDRRGDGRILVSDLSAFVERAKGTARWREALARLNAL